MTCGKLPPVGDRGQRYEVTCYDDAQDKRITIGWTDVAEHARDMATACELRPSWSHAWVTDRQATK